MKPESVMKIELFGVRGSTPTSMSPNALENNIYDILKRGIASGSNTRTAMRNFVNTLDHSDFGGYGGNTLCVRVSTANQSFLIDGGSGLLPIARLEEDYQEVHMFMTHFHWDHVHGLCFFPPLFDPEVAFHFYAVHDDLERYICQMLRKPFFHSDFDQTACNVHFHQLKPYQAFELGDISVTPYRLDHPQPCWGFRCESQGKVYSHCIDTEAVRITRESLGKDIGLYQNANLVLFDAQYTTLESFDRINWGHASSAKGIELACLGEVDTIIFGHHDPASDDAKIASLIKKTEEFIQVKDPKHAHQQVLKWAFAQEGMCFEI